MILTGQIHCLLDCWAEILDTKKIDYRPLYSGVWDAQFDVTATEIRYFSHVLDPKDWFKRCANLFGIVFTHWCGPDLEGVQPEQANIEYLTDHLRTRANRDIAGIMYMDLYYMSYSVHYKVKHIPHIVIVEYVEGTDCWHIKDPYFQWQGTVSLEVLKDGFSKGIAVDYSKAHPAEIAAVCRLFKKDVASVSGRLQLEVEKFVTHSVRQHGGYAPGDLFASIQEVGTVAKRFRGYQHILDYMAEQTGYDSKAGTEAISLLVKGWESLMLNIARFSILKREVDLDAFRDKLNTLTGYEKCIKQELSWTLTWMTDQHLTHPR